MLTLNPAIKDAPNSTLVKLTVNDGVYTNNYSFHVIIFPPTPSQMAKLMEMPPKLVMNPSNVKMKQGDQYNYNLPKVAEPSQDVEVRLQMDQKMKSFTDYKEKEMILHIKTDIN